MGSGRPNLTKPFHGIQKGRFFFEQKWLAFRQPQLAGTLQKYYFRLDLCASHNTESTSRLVRKHGLVLVQHNIMYQKNRDAHHALLSVFRERFDEHSGPEFAVPELLTGTKQRGGESTAAFERAVVRVGRASPAL